MSWASDTSTSSGVTSSGPIGIVPSKFLPAVHWVAARCHSRAVPSMQTTNPAIAASGLLGRDIAAAAPDHHAELALVVEPVAEGGLDQVAVGRRHRVAASDEHLGPGGERTAALGGMVGVVHPQAKDPPRRWNRRPELRSSSGRPSRSAARSTSSQPSEPTASRPARLARSSRPVASGDVDVAVRAAHVQPGSLGRLDCGKPHSLTSRGVMSSASLVRFVGLVETYRHPG